MFSKTVTPPYNLSRLNTPLRTFLGPTGWTFKVASDALSVSISVEDSLVATLKPGKPEYQAHAELDSDLEIIISSHKATFDADELVDQKTRAYEAIDNKAGEVSRRYITDRTAQEITYQLKYNSSLLWNSNGKPNTIDRTTYPGLYAEVMAFRAADPSTTIQTVVDSILSTAGAWYYKADQIEEQRRAGKIRVGLATSPMQVSDILVQTVNNLSQL